jgi:hypothetical protein
VPGAFTPTCTAQAPGYIEKYDEFKAKGINEIYILSVNDVFVTKYVCVCLYARASSMNTSALFLYHKHRAWKENLAPNGTRKSPKSFLFKSADSFFCVTRY